MTDRRTVLGAGLASALLASGLSAGAQSPLPAQAPAPAPPTMPAPALAALPHAQWSGTARLRFFGLNIYDATLWVDKGFSAARFAESGLVLELAYLRALKGDLIAERSITEMRRVGDVSEPQAQRWQAAMQTSFADVTAGDRITGLHDPAFGARFWFNAQPRAPIADPAFSRLFFGIWLSSATSEPALRQALLARAAP